MEIIPPKKIDKISTFMGVDPGTTHLGISILTDNLATLFQLKMERSPDPIKRIIDIYELFDTFAHNHRKYLDCVCIEGASFGDKYRQVELAEIRASIVIWCYERMFPVKIVPPKTIRKSVFGNGNIKAQDVWTNIPPDAANALACAYYSAMGL